MNFWYSWQIDYLLLLQQFRETTGGIFDNFFAEVTHWGETIIPLIVIATIYWCINTRLGTLIYLNFGVSTFICDLLKNIACIYRPWILDSRIQPVAGTKEMASGYSFPSGHTQNAISVWGTIAHGTKNKIFAGLLIILILLIAFSRNYLGVHTPQDVIVSFIYTTPLIFLMPKFMKWVEEGKNRDIWVYITAVFAVVACLLYEHFKSYPIDYVDGKLLVSPYEMRIFAYPKLGLFLGIFTGWLLNARFINFDGSKGNFLGKIIRVIVGIPILYFIYYNFLDCLTNYMDKKYAWFISSFAVIFFTTVVYPIIILFIEKLLKNKNNEEKEV